MSVGVRKSEIETPALLVDLDRMEGNLQRMAAFFRGVPAKLRPHFKNHKCPDLARMQLAAGAIGITCATLREAECLAAHGVSGILLANEIVDSPKIRRLVELARRTEVLVCVDEKRNVSDLAHAAGDRKGEVGVLVDVNVGLNRCGVPPGERSVALARAVAESGLRFRGLMGYEGQVLRKPPGPEKQEAVAAAMRPLMETRHAIESLGLPVEIVSVGGTGTYSISGCYPGVTEIQAGSYLLMDTEYRKCCTDFDLTLTMLANVISKTDGDRIIVDAGLKTLSCERGLPAVKDIPGLTVRRLTAEHGIIGMDDPAAPVETGDKIELWVHYSDATVSLHERLYGMRNGRVERVFQVEG
ncbi:MAG: DSD1 family PLP-dependent enzyme [Bryobacteraceae bacterium]